MQIIQVDKSEIRPLAAKKFTWKDTFRRTLYKKNYEKIRSAKKERNIIEEEENNLAVKEVIKIISSDENNIQIEREFFQPEPTENFYTPYSIYIPLQGEAFMNDELINTFPYIKQVSEDAKNEEKKQCYIDINEFFSNKRNMDIMEQWTQVKKKYLCPLDAIKALSLFVVITKKGTEVIDSLYKKYSPLCLKKVFMHKIFKSVKYIRPSPRLYKNIKISIELGDEINLKKLAETPKSLYCSVCFLYDCGKHHADPNLGKHDNHFYNKNNFIKKQTHIKKIIKLFKFYNELILDQQQMIEEAEEVEMFCSENCFKNLKKTNLKKLASSKYKLVSPLVKSIVEMGIYMFSYSPCEIAVLLRGQKGQRDRIPCDLLFLHFIEDCNLLNMISYKMHTSEKQLLMNEGRENQTQLEARQYKKKQVNYIQSRQDNGCPEIPICFHNFFQTQSVDPTCQNCSCKQRGFCLPSCQCTDSCKIQRIGCNCLGSENCESEKCICFKNKLECQPDLCLGCFPSSADCKKICCNNNQILRRMSKKILVGVSAIPGAGLGAFAGQDYLKNELITVYSGESINQDMDHIRQCMMRVLSFYNFDSPNGKDSSSSIDARFMGNKARFINHGNQGETNLHSVTKFSNGTEYIALYASRNIMAGEELKFNYDGNGLLYLNHRDKYPFIKRNN